MSTIKKRLVYFYLFERHLEELDTQHYSSDQNENETSIIVVGLASESLSIVTFNIISPDHLLADSSIETLSSTSPLKEKVLSSFVYVHEIYKSHLSNLNASFVKWVNFYRESGLWHFCIDMKSRIMNSSINLRSLVTHLCDGLLREVTLSLTGKFSRTTY